MDANLNHCLATGRSLAGFFHVVNHTPIDSYSKRQATVETATYGSEFIASKTATEQIIDLEAYLEIFRCTYQNKILFGNQHWEKDIIYLHPIKLGKQLHQNPCLLLD